MTPPLTALKNLLSDPLHTAHKIVPYLLAHFRVYRRRLFETFGSDTYSKPYPGHDLLMQHLNFRNGFFVECGANDGEMVDPTYYLEKFKGWHGILIEPLPKAAKQCIKNRPNSTIVQTALVDSYYAKKSIQILDCNAMSITNSSQYDQVEWVRQGEKTQNLTAVAREVPAQTLDSVLKAHQVPKEFDLLVLDVEGSEESVLSGFSLETYSPQFILIELHNDNIKHRVEQLLGTLYSHVTTLGMNDHLYRRNLL